MQSTERKILREKTIEETLSEETINKAGQLIDL